MPDTMALVVAHLVSVAARGDDWAAAALAMPGDWSPPIRWPADVDPGPRADLVAAGLARDMGGGWIVAWVPFLTRRRPDA